MSTASLELDDIGTEITMAIKFAIVKSGLPYAGKITEGDWFATVISALILNLCDAALTSNTEEATMEAIKEGFRQFKRERTH